MKKGHHRFFTRRYMGDTECRACGGSRLRREALAVKVQDLDIGQVGRLSVEEALAKVRGLRLNKAATAVAGEVRDEVLHRLRVPRARGPGLPDPGPADPHPSAAARPSASTWPTPWARAWSTPCTCWTSPPAACTPTTWTA